MAARPRRIHHRPSSRRRFGLSLWRDRHRGETMLVLGCGESLNELPAEIGASTIGVNDVGRKIDPTYLVVVNPRHQFKDDRFRFVEKSRAKAIFSQLDLGLRGRKLVRFRLGRRGGTDFSIPEALPYTRNSPYVALCLALYMGASRIGVIGVDFTDHHFYGPTGAHPLSRSLPHIDAEYRALAQAFEGVEIVNLSSASRLTALPKADLEAFLGGSGLIARTDAKAEPTKPATALAASSRFRIAVERHRPGIVGDLLDRLANTAARLGHRVTRNPAVTQRRSDVVSVVWNGRSGSYRGPVLYCEHGWLPRWHYQISPSGINAEHHRAPYRWDGQPLAAERLEALERHLAEIRRHSPGGPSSYMQTGAPALDDLPEDFLLVPLQMEWDTNIQRHVPSELRRMQGLVDHVSASDPPFPIVFKQHPADHRRGDRQLQLRMRRPADLLRGHRAGNIHQLLKSGRCRGIVTLNSNVAHDGLIWDVPSIVLGRNVWPRRGVTPFLTSLPSDWTRFEERVNEPERVACRRAYAYYLTRSQWTLEDAGDLEKVQRLFAGIGAEAPSRVRPTRPRVTPSRRRSKGKRPRPRRVREARLGPTPLPRKRIVNVFARNRGWLLEDLKQHFAAAAHPSVRVAVSERPQRQADAWIVLRANETPATPDPKRTLVQLHDLFDEALYEPGGRRHAIGACGGVVLTHPAQRSILEKSGIDLAGKTQIERPLGASEGFRPKSERNAGFTLGWVGRPVNHHGVDLKRLDWLVECLGGLLEIRSSLRVVLLGERLADVRRQIRALGVECDYLRRDANPYETYPKHYRKLDCLLITASVAPGPNSLFEALASGVPVVSTPVGWAPELLGDGTGGYLVDSVDAARRAVLEIHRDPKRWHEHRDDVAALVKNLTLESWITQNLDAAAGLMRPRSGSRPRRSRPLRSGPKRLRRAVCVGFSRWKHPWMRSYLRTFGELPRFCSERDLRLLRRTLADGHTVYVWGAPRRARLERALGSTALGLVTVEDGFLRSVGLGLKQTVPLSLVFDRTGIYYDTSRPSDLERLLEDLELGTDELGVADQFVELLVRSRLTKYNLTRSAAASLPQHSGKRTVLVCGQVENDASIKLGAPGIRTNRELLRWARERFPRDTIVYKAHPDVTIGRRPGRVSARNTARFADHDLTDASLPSCLDLADVVVVMTSLVGLEALLRHKEVHCLGRPFYGGLGLTRDHCPWLRARTQRTLPELVHAAYLSYPVYVSSRDARRLSASEAAASLERQLRSARAS